MDFSDIKFPGRQDPNINVHPADPWINTLYTGGPGADTREKLRRGYAAGYESALRDLTPWLPDDAPHKSRWANYRCEAFERAQIGDVVVPANTYKVAEDHTFLRYATPTLVMEFERVRVHGITGWLRRS